MTRNIIGRVATVAAVVASAVVAQPAVAQTGQLNIVGTVDVFQANGGTGNLVIDFLPNGGGVGTVLTCCFPGDQTGVFAILPPIGLPGVQTDLVFANGTGGPPATTPVPSVLLQIGGFTFTVNMFTPGNTGTPVNLTFDGNTTFATITATGTVTGPTIPGFANFVGAYSTQFPGQDPVTLTNLINSGGNILGKSVSATFVVSPIPEPATVALMGTGLVALLGVGLRRRTNV